MTRKGALIEEQAIRSLADTDRDAALAPLHSAACTYRIALGPRASQKVLTLREPSLGIPSQEAQQPPRSCVSAQGFSLHADTRCGLHPRETLDLQRHTLERLCCYITRPALGHKRLSRTRAGEVIHARRWTFLQLKTPYRDGTTHLVMTPLEFLQRLAALVPRPRLHLIRFHPREALDLGVGRVDGDSRSASTRARLSWVQLLTRV